MKILDFQKIDTDNHDRVTFIRVEPINLQVTLTEILKTLSDLSWINQFDQDYIREGYRSRALPTINDINVKLSTSTSDRVSTDAGEYVVSELSRSAIVQKLKYLDVPLAELYGKKKSGNPGFDFHTQNDCETLIFGEAKYVCGKNAYGRGLKQVVDFIEEKKDHKDLPDLGLFFSEVVLDNVVNGTKGYAIGFSSITTPTDDLIADIIKNDDYKQLLGYNEIILIAVNL